MLNSIRGWFSVPYYADPDEQRRAGYVNAILWFALAVLAAIVLIRGWGGNFFTPQNLLLIGMGVLVSGLRWLLRRGALALVGYVLVVSVAAALTYLAWTADGIRDVAYLANLIAALIAALLISWQAALVILGFTIVAGWGMAIAEATGRLTPSIDTSLNIARDYTAILVMVGLLIYLLHRSLESAAAEARASATQARAMNTELEGYRNELALRVEQRTMELARSTELANRRVEQLRAVSDVARTIASMQDIGSLLTKITELISSQFHHYHAGIFLIDEQTQFAELRAASSEGGLRMLARRHRLRLGGAGIVPHVATTGQPRVALNVSEDTQFLQNPDLPETRSEMALPLTVGDKLIGVLDIQSLEPSAFAEEDVEVLLTLANQAAIAIENARLFSETRDALDNVEGAYRGFLRQEWSGFNRRLEVVGIHFDGHRTKPIYSSDPPTASPDATGLVLPIVIHGNVVGELAIGSEGLNQSWSEDERAVLQAAADRIAIALENARLVQATEDRALRERALSEMGSQIGATVDFDTILQTAVREVGRIVGDTEVIIQMNTNQASEA